MSLTEDHKKYMEELKEKKKIGSTIDEVITALGMDKFDCIEDYFVWLDRKEDNVNSPSHYNQGGVECIDALAASLGEEGFKAYCRGNVIKYLWRLEHKGKSIEDAKKARWYLNKLIERMEENG